MARAIELAERGLYTAKPNPRVGCVLVKDDAILAEGWHRRAGGPHAEIVALQQAGDTAVGATAYLNLEPCSHHGRTPPCADALIKARLQRVVVSMLDPNPLVAGNGLRKLKQAGIAVECGMEQAAAERINPGFIKRMQQQLPYVRCKIAMSLDGRTAMASGESRWITGADARTDVHHWRASSAAIMTGIGTVLADNPSLNVRFGDAPHSSPPYADQNTKKTAQWGGHEQHLLSSSCRNKYNQAIDFQDQDQPLRVVLDSQLRMPVDATLLQIPGQTLIYTLNDNQQKIAALQHRDAEVCVLPSAEKRLTLSRVLIDLAKREVNDVLLEAGACLNGAMLMADLVDELIFYIAPSIMGDQALGAFHLPEITQMVQKRVLSIVDTRQIGGDWRIIARSLANISGKDE
ncbi:MAG: bifunctional diaminohydroxyphosphoribosylaminopyrimidine deaminase/5-amino-6-(5-phosphoribosylamino)uracil reductase RibD [Gammaproteobacteria bacterium]|nr:bifunctional diaminohydroxyphosphoribosylaminopyrimidine deaminase/5-amino-6-(5-phosphoribosylamino)uracil reductase RibD [Gammaproteobacteria bacterium]